MRETHELEEALHHHFKNPALLVTALTHTSYANEAKHGVRPVSYTHLTLPTKA